MTAMPKPLTPAEREAVIESVITSQALSGIEVPRELAEALLEQVMREPLPEIDPAEDWQQP